MPVDAEVEASAWADTFRTALMLIKADRDRDSDAWWVLLDEVPAGRLPLLIRLLSMFGAVHRDDAWFETRLAHITEAQATGELTGRVRDWMQEFGL
jgi:hypothetical protein